MRSIALLVLALVVGAAGAGAASDDESKVQALLELQRKSSSGVIDMDSKRFEEFVVGKARPYTVVVVADALNLHNQGKLQLGTLVKEFALVARTFAATQAGKPAAGKVFFARIEYKASQGLFGRMGIKSLPFVARIPPSTPITRDGAVKIAKEDQMEGDYPWRAEALAQWVQDKTGLAVGEIKRASIFHSRRAVPSFHHPPFAPGHAPRPARRPARRPLLRSRPLYAVGTLVVWWFSTSGGMYNIIRGVPMVGYDPRTRQSIMFMQGSGQLGMEGFIMGSLYSSFGLIVAAFVFVLPRVKDPQAQRTLAYLLLFFAFVSFRATVGNHLWKTGLHTHWYL
eukprot:scaffold5.g763.t1